MADAIGNGLVDSGMAERALQTNRRELFAIVGEETRYANNAMEARVRALEEAAKEGN